MTEIAADVSVDYGRLRSQLVFISAKKRVAHGCESGKARLDHIYRLKKPWRHALKTSKDEVIMKVIRYSVRYAYSVNPKRRWEERYHEDSVMDCIAFVSNNDLNADNFTQRETEHCEFLRSVCRELPWFQKHVHECAQSLDACITEA